MYLNAHKNQGPALEQLKRLVKVYLDGVEVHDVIIVDTKAGLIQKYQRNKKGDFVDYKGDAATEIIEGYASIRFA